MRRVALSVLLIANFFANQVLAEDVSSQPLTRADCVSNGMTWNDAANVCGEAAKAVEAMKPEPAQVPDAKVRPSPMVTDAAPGQPLTREDCKNAGMAWDDTGNVCGAVAQAGEEMAEEQEPANATPSEATSTAERTVLISIDKASQTMTVLLDGVQQYEWPVSTGLRGYTTPSGLTPRDR